MKRKGFTLIELLAIIVILAIIAVITVPIILNIIDNSKQGAATDSAYGYKDAISKWYISKLQDDNKYTLNGTYKISDGKLNNIDIPLSGNKPTSGSLHYTNSILDGGCLTIGEYKVTFDSKGNPSSAEKGECESITPSETILYYTYDSTAEEGLNGFITETTSELNPSWMFYIKEITQIGVTNYTQEGTIAGQTVQQGNFETLSECEAELNTIPQEVIEENDIKCTETNKKTTSEVCGVEDGTTFCLRGNDYENSVKTLSTTFPSCDDGYFGFVTCHGSGVYGRAYDDGHTVHVYEMHTDGNGTIVSGGGCYAYSDGTARCGL